LEKIAKRLFHGNNLELPAKGEGNDSADGALEAKSIALNPITLAGGCFVSDTFPCGCTMARHFHVGAQVYRNFGLADPASYRLAAS
jgi:hypothetical protein